MNNLSDSLNVQRQKYNWHERQASLRSWRMASFKSVKNPVEIELAPLTVVVGANSVGKSSLIQSILLVAQNASGVVRSSASQAQGTFELNSFLVQLGTFKEVKCDLDTNPANGRNFSLGGLWYIGNREFKYSERRPGEIRRMKSGESSIDPRKGDIHLDWSISFCADKKGYDGGVVSIDNSYASTIQDGICHQIIEAKKVKADPGLRMLTGKFDQFSFTHRSTVTPHEDLLALNELSDDQLEDLLHKEKNSMVYFRSGLPVSGLKSVSIVDYIFSNQSRVVINSHGEFMIDFSNDLGDYDVKESKYESKIKVEDTGDSYATINDALDAYVAAVAEVAQRILQQDQVGDDLNLSALGQLVEKNLLIPFSSFPIFFKNLFWENKRVLEEFLISARSLFNEIYAQSDWIHSKILCSIDGRRMRQPVFGLSKTSRLIEYWNRYLSESVVYLGPLRASPKATYGLGSGVENSNIPLGESGEFTAKKLFSEKNLKRYLVPVDGKIIDKRITLEEAVSLWYQELCISPEISDKIEVQAPGRQGYQMNIGSRTLANVGFGVSQILPVITLCLITDPGSLIMLEQPELHLNPGMQQKLADFLLEMVKTGRQIIVETHSEYLITRLRRRAATHENDHKYFGIVFAERDPKEGTSYRLVNVNEQGDLSEWPQGFFDHVAEDLRILMRKAAERQTSVKSEQVNSKNAKEE